MNLDARNALQLVKLFGGVSCLEAFGEKWARDHGNYLEGGVECEIANLGLLWSNCWW